MRELTDELTAIFKEIRGQERDAREALTKLDRGIVAPILNERIDDLSEACGVAESQDQSARAVKVRTYLHDVRESILGSIDRFRQPPQEMRSAASISPVSLPPISPKAERAAM